MLALVVVIALVIAALLDVNVRAFSPAPCARRQGLLTRRDSSTGSSGDAESAAAPLVPPATPAAACGPCAKNPLCNGEYLDKGCDGTGRISGGVGAVLPWFPVKVYRPCPSYLAAGYQYRREGQTMDQVLFSEPSDRMKAEMAKIRLENKDAGIDRPREERERVDGTDAEAIDRILREKLRK